MSKKILITGANGFLGSRLAKLAIKKKFKVNVLVRKNSNLKNLDPIKSKINFFYGDLRKSERIDFVGGIRGLEELSRRVDSGDMAVAFALYPVSMDQLLAIADAGEIMPPKTTWFEPKLRSGLFVHSIKT